MSDLICRKTMQRCQHPGMCSTHGGCQPDNGFESGHLDLGKFVDWVWSLKAERDQLKAENEALRYDIQVANSVVLAEKKDAERYRWLRDRCTAKCGFTLTIAQVGMWDLTGWSGDDPDREIDAAMAKEASQ